jgi:hypothetical protein
MEIKLTVSDIGLLDNIGYGYAEILPKTAMHNYLKREFD